MGAMHVKTFKVQSDNPGNDYILNIFNHLHQSMLTFI